jgi:hypothetical protein
VLTYRPRLIDFGIAQANDVTSQQQCRPDCWAAPDQRLIRGRLAKLRVQRRVRLGPDRRRNGAYPECASTSSCPTRPASESEYSINGSPDDTAAANSDVISYPDPTTPYPTNGVVL